LNNYEALFIFSTSLNEEALETILERIRGEITKLDGNTQGSRVLGKRALARPLKEREAGQYVKIDFSMEPGGVGALMARFKLDESVFRVQIVRVNNKERSATDLESGAKEEKKHGES